MRSFNFRGARGQLKPHAIPMFNEFWYIEIYSLSDSDASSLVVLPGRHILLHLRNLLDSSNSWLENRRI